MRLADFKKTGMDFIQNHQRILRPIPDINNLHFPKLNGKFKRDKNVKKLLTMYAMQDNKNMLILSIQRCSI